MDVLSRYIILSLWFVEHLMQLDFPDVFDDECTDYVLSRNYLVQRHESMKKVCPKSIEHYFSLRFAYEVLTILGRTKYKRNESFLYDTFKYSLRINSPIAEGCGFFPAAEYEACYWFLDRCCVFCYLSVY